MNDEALVVGLPVLESNRDELELSPLVAGVVRGDSVPALLVQLPPDVLERQPSFRPGSPSGPAPPGIRRSKTSAAPHHRRRPCKPPSPPQAIETGPLRARGPSIEISSSLVRREVRPTREPVPQVGSVGVRIPL